MEIVPLQVWTDFLSRVDMVVQQVDRLDRLALTIYLVTLIGVCFVIEFTYHVKSYGHAILRTLLYAACFGTLLMLYLYLRAYSFNKLKTFCSEEGAQTFLPFDFVLECHSELPTNTNRSHQGYYLYFIPSTTRGDGNDDVSSPGGICRQHGYLRVQVGKDPFFGWNTAPILPYYDYMPYEMVPVSLADWSEFWAKMDAVSSAAVSSTRRHYLIMFLYTTGMLNIGFLKSITAFVCFYCFVIIPLLLCWIYNIKRCRSIDSELERVCNEYADKFEQHGVYMEFRKEIAWTRTIGGFEHRYIYLFPIMQPNREEEQA